MSGEDSQLTVSVTGVGRVAATADVLVLNLAVETRAVTARDQNDTRPPRFRPSRWV
jgi:uncharacterized protein YggE